EAGALIGQIQSKKERGTLTETDLQSFRQTIESRFGMASSNPFGESGGSRLSTVAGQWKTALYQVLGVSHDNSGIATLTALGIGNRTARTLEASQFGPKTQLFTTFES